MQTMFNSYHDIRDLDRQWYGSIAIMAMELTIVIMIKLILPGILHGSKAITLELMMQTMLQFNTDHDRVDGADHRSVIAIMIELMKQSKVQSIAIMIELMMQTMVLSNSHHGRVDDADHGTVQ